MRSIVHLVECVAPRSTLVGSLRRCRAILDFSSVVNVGYCNTSHCSTATGNALIRFTFTIPITLCLHSSSQKEATPRTHPMVLSRNLDHPLKLWHIEPNEREPLINHIMLYMGVALEQSHLRWTVLGRHAWVEG